MRGFPTQASDIFISAKGLVFGNKGNDDLLATLDKPCAVQLFGHDPEFMYRAARDERIAKFDIVDINAGCPVKKVFGNGDGSALMLNPTLLGEVVQARARKNLLRSR